MGHAGRLSLPLWPFQFWGLELRHALPGGGAGVGVCLEGTAHGLVLSRSFL